SLRIERLFLADRSWDLEAWRQRYLDHPLVGLLARRLIWTIDQTPVAWLDGRLVDVRDKQFAKKTESIRLCHPSTASPADVVAWRAWLERHQVRQPFKQAHREV